MNKNPNKIRMILKFDTGADGFKKMIYVLAVGAILVLVVGAFFINTVLRELRGLS